MPRTTGTYRITKSGGEAVRAFVPLPLPPAHPPLEMEAQISASHDQAMAALGKLAVAAEMVPNADWFLYGFVRKEALITSQIEGTQATLRDVLAFEAGERAERPDDVREVCNYLDALHYARREMNRRKGLPLATRLLCNAHLRLMSGARGADKQPGEIRRSQNWIGGDRPGNARFVPPPPDALPEALSSVEKWMHASDPLPPLVRVGLAHVQFETIHPFLDGNGRIGRLLIALLVEHWKLLSGPFLYVSVAFKRHRREYYERLDRVRTDGDWEAWTRFFLDCVRESAEDGVAAATKLFALVSRDRAGLSALPNATVSAIRLFESLPRHPIVTLASTVELLGASRPTCNKALAMLVSAGILREASGKRRDRIYAYGSYLDVLQRDTEQVGG